MKRHLRRIIFGIMIVLALPGHLRAGDGRTVPGLPGQLLQIPGCPYELLFPHGAHAKVVEAGGMEVSVLEGEPMRGDPYLRAECSLIPSGLDLRGTLHNIADNTALEMSEISVSQEDTGPVGTYSGFRTAGGFRIRLFGKMYVLRRHLVHLVVSEEVGRFPSDAAIIFLNSLHYRNKTSGG